MWRLFSGLSLEPVVVVFKSTALVQRPRLHSIPPANQPAQKIPGGSVVSLDSQCGEELSVDV